MSEGTTYAVGFYPWKRKILRTFRPEERFVFVGSPSRLPQGHPLNIATWGALFGDEEFPAGSRITRYEDGFIRSAGLGAKFTPALSWVADRRGIYYDATKPSDLEFMLGHEELPDPLQERARRLREKIIASGLTKYNLPGPTWTKPTHTGKFILVAGQVESDASIRLGSTGVKTNLGLLQRVRRENPDDYIVYRPHPDVVAGVRRPGQAESSAKNHCDSVATSAPIHALIEAADEVHVNTSLTGFEALIRGKKVVTYGQPFYAGWGLTLDRDPPARRTRHLELDELVAGALIRYPLYRSAATGRTCGPEEVVEEIAQGVSGPRPGLMEFFLGQLSGTRFWHRYCSQ
jgi:capsular polysaccharide export protein